MATIKLDALVYSAGDADEVRWAQPLEAAHATDGRHRGARRRPLARRDSGPLERRRATRASRDSYGCGDSFAAGFTFGLASGSDVLGAAQVGARCGAEMLTRIGAP